MSSKIILSPLEFSRPIAFCKSKIGPSVKVSAKFSETILSPFSVQIYGPLILDTADSACIGPPVSTNVVDLTRLSVTILLPA